MKKLLLILFLGIVGLVRADDIALLYALDADLAEFKEVAQERGQPTLIGSRSIRRFQLANHTIYAVKMGSGAVETAASAQALLTRFPCDRVFSIGPAGALSDELIVGSWYRARCVVACQRGTEDAAGFILSKVATYALPWNTLTANTTSNQLMDAPFVTLASGEEFVASESRRARIRSLAKADAIDMNTFGLSLVCNDHNIPLYVWRVVSDLANEQASEDFRAYVTNYKGEGGRAIASLISSIPPNPNTVDSYPALRQFLEENE